MVGGTGLYFAALTRGLAETPAVPPPVRDAAGARYDREGEAAVRGVLAACDPESESRIAPGDRQRLVRALSVHMATGRPLSAWRADTRSPLGAGAWRGLVLESPRADLYARCDARFDAMLAGGALDEVRALAARGVPADRPALKAVGVRELTAHLRGDLTLDEAADAARRETRRYAKRQLTWFRNQAPDWPRLPEPDVDAALQRLGA